MANNLELKVAEVIKENNLVKLSELIEKEALLDVEDEFWYTSLHVAVQKQRLDCLKMLLQHPKCQINKKSMFESCTSLYEACRSFPFSLEIVEELLRNGADPNIGNTVQLTLLHLACENGRLELVELLLKNGANINQTTLNNETALHFAVLNCHIEIVEFLLKSNANTEIQNIYGLNPLMLSIKRKFIDAFRVLLPVTKNLNCLGKDNETAISLATLTGNREMVYKLLEKNVNINSCDKYCPLALSDLYYEENFDIFQQIWSRADFNILSKNEIFIWRLQLLTIENDLLILKHVLQTENPEFKRLNSEVKLFQNIFLINFTTSVSEEYFEKHKDDLFSIVQGLYKQEIKISSEFMKHVCSFFILCPYRLEILQFFIEKFDFPINSKLIPYAFECHPQMGYCMLQNCSKYGRELNRRSVFGKQFNKIIEAGLLNNFFTLKSVKSLVEISRNVVRESVCEATSNNRKLFCSTIKNLPCPNIIKDILLFKAPVNQ